jgi:hypothetical protein
VEKNFENEFFIPRGWSLIFLPFEVARVKLIDNTSSVVINDASLALLFLFFLKKMSD